jgi:hypothetical protein
VEDVFPPEEEISCPCWAEYELQSVTTESQMEWAQGSCVVYGGIVSIETYGKSFISYEDQESCGTTNIISSGIQTITAEQTLACSSQIEARCAEIGTPLLFSDDAPHLEYFCPCWEESELEIVTMDTIGSPESACQLTSIGSDKQASSIDTFKESYDSIDGESFEESFEGSFYIELNSMDSCELSLCKSMDQSFELRFEDALVCYSHIEARCAAMGTPIDGTPFAYGYGGDY